MNTRSLRRVICLTVMALVPVLAQAHPGHSLGLGFYAGLLHPWSGLDHLLAMLAVGIWAAQLGGRMSWALPACFVMLMLVGAGLGFVDVEVGAVEQGLAASVLILGVLIASNTRAPLSLSMLLTGCFAIFHGYAHGAEMPVQSSPLSYLSGFVLSTSCLHLIGLTVGERLTNKVALRWAGAVIGLSGVCMLVV